MFIACSCPDDLKRVCVFSLVGVTRVTSSWFMVNGGMGLPCKIATESFII